jgi:hypothetical protein
MNLENPKEIKWDIEEIKKAYKEAAEADHFLFGDFDYSYVWMEDNAEGS